MFVLVPQRRYKNDKLKGYGVKIVKIRNSKVCFQMGVGFILFYWALGVILCFTVLEVYSRLKKCW